MVIDPGAFICALILVGLLTYAGHRFTNSEDK